jgi:nucleotide-binding universal stress UspA family protein
MKVMVCYDGSDRSQEALEMAVELFKPQGAEVIIVTAVEEPLDASSADEESFRKWRDKREEDLNKAAQWVANHGLEVDAMLVIGDPRKMIIEAARRKEPDMLVLARRGGSGTRNMVIGSVSLYIVRHSRFPVIVV